MDPTRCKWSVGILEDNKVRKKKETRHLSSGDPCDELTSREITACELYSTLCPKHSFDLWWGGALRRYSTAGQNVKSLQLSLSVHKKHGQVHAVCLQVYCFCHNTDKHSGLLKNKKKYWSRLSLWQVEPAILRTKAAIMWSISCKSPDSSTWHSLIAADSAQVSLLQHICFSMSTSQCTCHWPN